MIKGTVQHSVIAYPVILKFPQKRVQPHSRPLVGELKSGVEVAAGLFPITFAILPSSDLEEEASFSVIRSQICVGSNCPVVWYGYTMLNPWFHKWGLIGRPAWTYGAGLGAQLVVLSSHTTLFQCSYEPGTGSKYLKMCFVILKSFHSTVVATMPWIWARPISHCYH